LFLFSKHHLDEFLFLRVQREISDRVQSVNSSYLWKRRNEDFFFICPFQVLFFFFFFVLSMYYFYNNEIKQFYFQNTKTCDQQAREWPSAHSVPVLSPGYLVSPNEMHQLPWDSASLGGEQL
jgi:hypothetical protein